MLLVDAIRKDEKTGKTDLTGIFDAIEVPHTSHEFSRQAWIYLSLTDMFGTVDLVIRWIELSNGQVLSEHGPSLVRSEDRLASVEVVVRLPVLPVPHSGSYAIELYSFGERIGSVRVTATIK